MCLQFDNFILLLFNNEKCQPPVYTKSNVKSYISPEIFNLYLFGPAASLEQEGCSSRTLGCYWVLKGMHSWLAVAGRVFARRGNENLNFKHNRKFAELFLKVLLKF